MRVDVQDESIDDLLRQVAATDDAPIAARVPAIAGRYRVGEPLGAGGLGLVHSGWDPQLQREVAIKFVRPDRSAGVGGAKLQSRLRREAQALARLDHASIVKVFDVGEAAGQVYIAMERVDGVTLAEWLRAATRTRREILAVFRRAGEGLAAAHEAGVVHRDFKPHNVLVEPTGRVVVVDFGLAHETLPSLDDTADHEDAAAAADSGGSRLTQTGAFVGTRGYAAPEQHGGDPSTPFADQYSFCVSLAEALTGRRPTDASALDGSGEPIRSVLARGLAETPSDRWPSMTALLSALELRSRARWRWATAAVAVVGLAGSAWALAAPLRSHDAIGQPRIDGSADVRAEASALVARGRAAADEHQDEALRDLESAFFLARSGHAPDLAFEAALSLAGIEYESGRVDDARQWLEHAQALGGSTASPSAQGRLLLVHALLETDPAVARRDIETAIDLLASDPEEDAAELGEAHVRAGILAHALSQTELAQRYFERARGLCGAEAPRCLGHALGEQGKLERELGHAEASVELLQRAVKLQAESVGRDASTTAGTRGILGVALSELGRFDEARVELDETIRVLELPQHRDNVDLALAYEAYGLFHEMQGDLAAAERAYQRSLATRETTIGRDDPFTAATLMRLASTAYARADYEGALRYGLEARSILAAHPDGDRALLGSTYGLTAEARSQLGQREAARDDAGRAVATLASSDRLPEDLARARFLLARLSWPDVDRREHARALARDAEAYLAGAATADPELLAEIRAWRAEHDR
ncbi:MAG TPA: serine/threonine-protein kinase [Nannocystaceae bacterium]|nr:serine/threonine-protein kinase [Nannocystaceae bacterium]